ncbi:MAG TPA: hypothetical protein VLS52_08635 [Rudaea sp.]|nr:hypothetical protein [Rudaea sp.]
MRCLTRLAVAVFGLCIGLVCAPGAFAFPVTWTLSGATFNDGGTATGSFVYDADTNTLSSWSVSVAGGNTATFPAITYDNISDSSTVSGQGATLTGVMLCSGGTCSGSVRQLRMPAVSPLTNAGGTIAIDTANLYQGECFNCSPYRSFTAGNLVGTAAPAITSANGTTFMVNATGSFTIVSTAAPVAALSETGTLPAGVTFTDNGDGTATLAGTASAAGTFPLTITASNGVAPDATQNFTLTVQAPAVVVPTPGLTSTGALLLALLLLLAGFAAQVLLPRRG